MRKLLVFLLLFLLPVISFAQISDEEYLQLDLDSIERNESVTNEQFLNVGVNWKSRELEKIEADMQQMNPELVESLKGESEQVKLGEYRSWLAQKTFEDFYERYMKDLESYSQKYGRKIEKRELYKDQKRGDWVAFEYKLSTEDLTDCHVDPVFGDKLCYEPDGYVQYHIRYSENTESGKKRLRISKDVPEENRSSSYDFTLNNRGGEDYESRNGSERHRNTYMLSYTAIDQEYNKIAKMRYYIVKDLLGGMCKITCKDCLIDGQIVTMSKCDTDAKTYRSNLIPGWVAINYVENYQNESTRRK